MTDDRKYKATVCVSEVSVMLLVADLYHMCNTENSPSTPLYKAPCLQIHHNCSYFGQLFISYQKKFDLLILCLCLCLLRFVMQCANNTFFRYSIVRVIILPRNWVDTIFMIFHGKKFLCCKRLFIQYVMQLNCVINGQRVVILLLIVFYVSHCSRRWL